MKRMMFLLLFAGLFMIAGCGSSGVSKQDTRVTGDDSSGVSKQDTRVADTGSYDTGNSDVQAAGEDLSDTAGQDSQIIDNGTGQHTATILREFEDQDGNKYTCTLADSQPDPDMPIDYDCVKDGTTDAYNCVLEKDINSPTGFGTKFRSCKLKKDPYKPPCENPLKPGDHKSGRQCWNPPTDYCKDGWSLDGGAGWYCTQGGTHCCRLGRRGCFLCDGGWVDVEAAGLIGPPNCFIDEENKQLSESECEAIVDKLPQKTKDCMKGIINPTCIEDINKDPVCQNAIQAMLNVKAICPADSK